MKKQVVKLWDKIIIVLLGLLGIFSSCVPMYGAVVPEYQVNGTVMDKTGKPIQDIRITGHFRTDDDTLYTTPEGKFYVRSWGRPHLKIEDIDEEANGGEFETQEIDVNFTDADLIKRGREGKTPDKYAKTVNIELEKKK